MTTCGFSRRFTCMVFFPPPTLEGALSNITVGWVCVSPKTVLPVRFGTWACAPGHMSSTTPFSPGRHGSTDLGEVCSSRALNCAAADFRKTRSHGYLHTCATPRPQPHTWNFGNRSAPRRHDQNARTPGGTGEPLNRSRRGLFIPVGWV